MTGVRQTRRFVLYPGELASLQEYLRVISPLGSEMATQHITS